MGSQSNAGDANENRDSRHDYRMRTTEAVKQVAENVYTMERASNVWTQ